MSKNLSKKDIKEKIKSAMDLVNGIEEPYKTAAFQVIFSKLLGSDDMFDNTLSKKPSNISMPSTENIDLDKNKQELAKKCGVKISELDEFFDFHDNVVVIINPLHGSPAEVQLLIAKCVLAWNCIVLDKKWTSSKEFNPSYERFKINSKNFGQNVMKYELLFRSRGVGKSTEYSITAKGLEEAFKTIKTLIKSDSE